MNDQIKRMADFTAERRLPAMFHRSEFVDAGGLMSYAPNLTVEFRRAAGVVGKVLKGVRPADLPVEEPTKLELVVNLKTAKAIGIRIPQSILVRADRVIE
jgi:putative ABC transport system substrate-binding protein